MSVVQPAVQWDLFGAAGPAPPAPDAAAPELQALVRARLHAALALVRGADTMPWPDMLSIIREDNAFRYDRLYAVMNAGTEMDAGN